MKLPSYLLLFGLIGAISLGNVYATVFNDNVGIGTSSPTNQLHILNSGTAVDTDSAELVRLQNSGLSSSSSRLSIIAGNAGDSTVRFGDTDQRGAGAIQYNHATSRLVIVTDTEEQMAVDGQGFVSIGSTNPTNRLLVRDTGSDVTTDTSEIIRLQNSGLSSSSSRLSIIAGNAGESSIRFGDTDSRAVGAITYFHSTDSLRITTTGGEQMVVDSSGRVGIGTLSPLQKLDVSGNIRLTGNIVSPNDICIGSC